MKSFCRKKCYRNLYREISGSNSSFFSTPTKRSPASKRLVSKFKCLHATWTTILSWGVIKISLVLMKADNLFILNSIKAVMFRLSGWSAVIFIPPWLKFLHLPTWKVFIRGVPSNPQNRICHTYGKRWCFLRSLTKDNGRLDAVCILVVISSKS